MSRWRNYRNESFVFHRQSCCYSHLFFIVIKKKNWLSLSIEAIKIISFVLVLDRAAFLSGAIKNAARDEKLKSTNLIMLGIQ